MARTTRTTTTARKPGILDRLRGRKTHPTTTTTTTTHSQNPITGKRTTKTKRTTDAPAHHHANGHTNGHPATHHRRKPTMGDKISGAMMKMKGSATHRPGVKAAGTRRMHGTDGRGSHRY